jgi:GNAT superfamily N-acetyltransferase
VSNLPADFAGASAERLADAIEAAACRDMYAAAPTALQLAAKTIDAATVLIAPTLPVTYFNRVIGLGDESPATVATIRDIAALYTAANVASYWVHLIPSAQPADAGTLLEQSGLKLPPRRSWAKFLRNVIDPPPITTELRLREATPADADAVGKVITSAFGMPSSIGPWFGALVGRPGWTVLVAEAADVIVATGAVFIAGDRAWLGAGSTLADSRGRGAQSALLSARIRIAAERGCHIVATETGEPAAGEPNPSLANIRRAGFVQVCSRLNYASA